MINIGTLLYFVLAWLTLILLLSIIEIIPIKCCKKLQKMANNILSNIFFNGLLAFFDGTFFLIFLTAIINIKQSRDSKVPRNQSFYIAILAIVVCILSILVVSYYLLRNKSGKLNDKKQKKRCGYIYQDLNQTIYTLFFPILQWMRFIALVLIIIY